MPPVVQKTTTTPTIKPGDVTTSQKGDLSASDKPTPSKVPTESFSSYINRMTKAAAEAAATNSFGAMTASLAPLLSGTARITASAAAAAASSIVQQIASSPAATATAVPSVATIGPTDPTGEPKVSGGDSDMAPVYVTTALAAAVAIAVVIGCIIRKRKNRGRREEESAEDIPSQAPTLTATADNLSANRRTVSGATTSTTVVL